MSEKMDFGTFYFRTLKEGDIKEFADNMRTADRRELKRWTGNHEAYELERACTLSDVLWVGCKKDGTLLSMFGGKRANVLDETGVIWELSTEEVNKNKLLFAKASKVGFDLVCKSLPDVGEFYNYVDTEYQAAVNWIEWLGGCLTATKFLGKCGGVFQQFIIGNPHFRVEEGED